MKLITASRPDTLPWLQWLAAITMLVVLQLFAMPVHAQALSRADEKSVRAAVEGQLAAFAKDDAKKAFSFARKFCIA